MEHLGPFALFDAAVVVVTAVVYAVVGHRLGARPVAPHAEAAARLFAIWWYGLGVYTVGRLAQVVVYRAGATGLVLHVAIVLASLVVVFLAIWGLVYYLLFIYTGDERLLPATLAFYVALFVATVYFLVGAGPAGVVLEGNQVLLRYREPLEGPVTRVLIALLVGIPLLSAAAYASLLFRVRDRTQRYRIAMVSTMFLVWLGTVLVQSLFFSPQGEVGRLFGRLVGLVAALGVLAAFFPPAWAQERFDVRSSWQVPERVVV